MPTGPENERSRQHTFRIPLGLDDRIERYALRQGIARNRAVVDLLTKALDGEVHQWGPPPAECTAPIKGAPANGWGTPCGSPQDAPSSPLLAQEVYERLTALEAKLEALEAPKAQAYKAPVARTSGGVLNEKTQYLGSLCERGHDYQGTGQSRRSNANDDCLDCKALRTQARRASRKVNLLGESPWDAP